MTTTRKDAGQFPLLRRHFIEERATYKQFQREAADLFPKELTLYLLDVHARGGHISELTVIDKDGNSEVIQIDSVSENTDTEALERNQQIINSARERGRIRAAEILAGPDMLSAAQMAERLGTTEMTVGTMRKRHELLGIVGATRGYKYPEWQLDENDKPFKALPQICERLGGSEWTLYRYLTSPHEEFEGGPLTGLDALRQGRDAEAIEIAETTARSFS